MARGVSEAMPQFRDWKPHVAAWTSAAQTRRAEFRERASDLAERGRENSGQARGRAVEVAKGARRRVEGAPRAIVDGMRRRVNWLDLATKHDVEMQSRLGRNRVSLALEHFLEAQRRHDEELLAAMRAELRVELQTFAAAIEEDVLTAADDDFSAHATRSRRGARADLDYFDDDDEDDEDNDIAADDTSAAYLLIDTCDTFDGN